MNAQSWEISAGAMSVAFQMLTNGGDTEGLFHGAFMQSGAPLPVGDLTLGQKHYDMLVADTGCSSAADTLECLRQAPFSILKAAVDSLPSVFGYQVRNGSLILSFPA
jgi:carboxylesterase type B